MPAPEAIHESLPQPKTSLKISPSLATPEQYAQAARVLYDAFKLKIKRLEFFPKTPEQALRIIAQSLHPDRGLYALQEGKVIGVIGLEYGAERFIRVSLATLTEVFGLLGGIWRYGWLRLLRLVEPLDPKAFRIEPLAVAAEARGQGVGSALIHKAFERARALGYTEVIIGVVNSNSGAKKLYERHGFRVFKTTQYGFLTRRAGFTGAYTLRKTL